MREAVREGRTDIWTEESEGRRESGGRREEKEGRREGRIL